MFCWNCGRAVNQGDRFCGKCGSAVEEQSDTTGKNATVKGIRALLVMSAVMLVFLVLVILLSGGENVTFRFLKW